MKRIVLFKYLIDTLFVFLAIIFVSSFLLGFLKGINKNIETQAVTLNSGFSPMLMIWQLLVLVLFLLFMLGIWNLRKVSNELIAHKYFTAKTIFNLSRSGIYFLTVGILSSIFYITGWVVEMLKQSIIFPNAGLFFSVFLSIIGLFFKIQSDISKSAKELKEENDLTI